MNRAEVKYSTVQNWYPGDENGKGGVLNLVTKRGDLRGVDSKLSWTQVETGSAITWKYPSCILRGDNSQAEFYSVAVTNNYQEADTGTKMIHLGKNTKSTIISKGISAGHSQNSYRGLVRAASTADNARNYSSCDSLLLGSDCGAHTFPYMDVHNDTAIFEHEATTSKISEDQLFYCNQRGIPTEQAVGLIVNGYAKEVLQKLPMEFAVEAQILKAQWDDGIYSKSKIFTNPVKANIFLTLSLTFRSFNVPPFDFVLFRILSRIRRPLDAIYVRSLHSMTIRPLPFSMRGAKIVFTSAEAAVFSSPSRVTRVQSSNCSIVVFIVDIVIL